MKIISMTLSLAVFAVTVVAQVAPKSVDWAEGPVRHLMVPDEMKQWKSIRTEQDAQAFIDLFWAKRDPSPNTIRNEFQEDFEARVKFADEKFSNGRTRGAMSDPGRVFILLGPPYRVSGRAGASAASASVFGGTTAPRDARGQIVVGRPTAEPNKQYWMYAHDRKPKFIKQADFTIVFADEGKEDWQLAITERINPEFLLLEAAKASIVSPNLTKVPEHVKEAAPRVTSFKSAALKSAFDQLRAGATELRPATLMWGEFVTSEGDYFVAAQLYVSGGSDLTPKVTSFAVVENASGEIVDIKESETTLTPSGSDAFVETTLQVERGEYATTFGIASEGRVVAAARAIINVEGLDPRSAGVSPLLLATSVYPLKGSWQPTDPFTFGGLKVVPKGDAVFAASGDLWYFVELRNPGVTDAGVPNVRVQVDIVGKTSQGSVALTLPMKDASLARLAGETKRFGLGSSIPLESFVPGDYTMKVQVLDVVLGKDYELRKPFRVRG